MSGARAAAGLLAAAIAALPGPARAADCPPFRELRPARIVRDRSVWWLTRSVDPVWFACARKAGGKVSARSEVERGGSWDLDSSEGNVGPDLRAGAWASNYCGRSGKADPARVRFMVTGEGPLAPMGFTTEPIAALCGCTVYPSAGVEAKPGPAGLSLRFSIAAAHLACLRTAGGSLDLRAYTGKTAEEALAKARPAWALRGIEQKPELTVTVPRKALCADGAAHAVIELAGRGPLGELTGNAQEQVKLDCR